MRDSLRSSLMKSGFHVSYSGTLAQDQEPSMLCTEEKSV